MSTATTGNIEAIKSDRTDKFLHMAALMPKIAIVPKPRGRLTFCAIATYIPSPPGSRGAERKAQTP